MYNRRDNQYNNGRNQAGYGGGGSYQSGYNTNVPVGDNFQQINNLDYEIDNIRKQREMIEQQQAMLEQQQRYQLQRNEPWASGKDSFDNYGESGSQISVWDQLPSQFSGGRQGNYGGGRQAPYASTASFGRRNDRNRDSRGSSRGNNSRGSYTSRGGNNSRSSFNTSGNGNNARSRGEKRSAPASNFTDKRMRSDGGAILQRGATPNAKQRGRIDVALGQIVRSIKERFPDKLKAMPWPILKDTLRKRLTTVLSGKPVGPPEEIYSLYRDLYPEDDDKALIVYAEQKKLEKGGADADDGEELTKTSHKDGDEPKVKEKNPAAILHKLVKQRLELMLTRAYVEDLQETAEKYKPEEEENQEVEGDKEEQQDGEDDQKQNKDPKGSRKQNKPRRKIPINVVKDAEENKYDEFMQGLDKEPHDYLDKMLLDYVRKDLPSMRDIMNTILLNGIVPWRLRQGMPWEKYNPDLLVRPKAFYMTWVCSPTPPSIEAVKLYLSEGGYDVVAVKRPWRGLYMYVVLNKKEEYEKLLQIRNIRIEDSDIIMESSDKIVSGNRAGLAKQMSEGMDGQTQQSETDKDEQTQGDQQDDTQQEECVGNGDRQSQEVEHDNENENSQIKIEEQDPEQLQEDILEAQESPDQGEEQADEKAEEQGQQQPQQKAVAAVKSQSTRRSSRRMSSTGHAF